MTNERLNVLKAQLASQDATDAMVEELFDAVEQLQTDNARLTNAIVAMATGSAAGEPPTP